MKKILLASFAFLFLATACSTMPVSATSALGSTEDEEVLNPDRFGEQKLAEGLRTNLRYPEFQRYPVIVTTFVDLNHLDKTSVFGRLMAEKLLHQLNQAGFHVVEIRRSQDLFIKKEVGEMILTRDIGELAKITKAKSILAGTYVATTNAIIINARIVDIESPQIVSTFSYEVPLTDEIENLLSGEAPF